MFKILTKEQFDALTADQQAYYLAQKKEHDDKELDKKITEAATKVAEVVVGELKATVEEQKEEITKLTGVVDEYDKKYEAALTDLNRAKSRQGEVERKAIGDMIEEKLSTPEGLKMLKDYAKGRAAFSMDFDVDTNANKAVGTMGKPTANGGGVAPDFIAPVGIAHEIVQARNIIPVYPTSSDVIKYVQFTKKEGGFATVAAGAQKPQIDYNTTPVTAPVRKIAGYVTLQEEFLEDIAGAPAWLARELPQAYMDAETFQIMKGDGTGENLSGLYSVWAQALVLPKGTVDNGSNAWDKIAAALAQVRRNLRASDAIWISPEDYMELLINKGNTDEYTYPIVSDFTGTLTIGGVPIFQHTVFTSGQGLAGDFKRGTAIFQKKAMTMKTSTEHADNFIKNLVTILLEGRIALPVFFPESFIKISFAITT